MIPRRLATWGKRSNKYGNRRIKVAGVSFDSQSEQRRWEELKLLEMAGEIRYLVLHPRYPLSVNGVHICDYVADYGYECRGPLYVGQYRIVDKNEWVKTIEDYKAGAITQTDAFKIKRKLMKALYDIDILITGKTN